MKQSLISFVHAVTQPKKVKYSEISKPSALWDNTEQKYQKIWEQKG